MFASFRRKDKLPPEKRGEGYLIKAAMEAIHYWPPEAVEQHLPLIAVSAWVTRFLRPSH